jgi:long-chain acyl-CoA synthetase
MDTNAQSTQFKSLHHFFLNAAQTIHQPDQPYLYEKVGEKWVSYTYGELLEKIDQIAAFMLHEGVKKGDRVALILENSPEYICLDQAMQKIGAVNVSIYPTLTPEETAFVINDSGSVMLVVGNNFLLRKFRKVESDCPGVRKVIMNLNAPEDGKFIQYETMLRLGAEYLPAQREAIRQAFESVGHEDISTFIYTSGTTGVPKGAMLTHHNFMSNCVDAKELCPALRSTDLYLSFLPLSHVYERMATYFLSTYTGAQIAFAESIDKVAQNVGEIRPTVMACVPRVLERVHDKVIAKATEKGGISAKIFHWSIRVGEQVRKAHEEGRKPGSWLEMQRGIAEKLVFSKIKARLGGRIRMMVSGGGALPPHIGEFFGNIGLKVQEGYGLTETSPFISVNEYHRQVYGTVGRIAPSQQVAIQNIDTGAIICVQDYHSFDPEFASDEGEILAKGPNIMKGYWNRPDETAIVFDNEGWFHTGDIGRFEKGYLKITDRLKNMLVTSLGKNIYPTPVENTYLQSPRIEQIFIIADKREYVTALVVPSKEELMRKFGYEEAWFEQPEKFVNDEQVKAWLEEDIRKLGEVLAKYARIREFLVKRHPFTLESGELTITQKTKRKIVLQNYEMEIEAMYAS